MSCHLIDQLNYLKTKGFIHDFQFLPTSELQCLTLSGRIYGIERVHISFLTCSSTNVTIYKITAYDGIQGLCVDFWEDQV